MALLSAGLSVIHSGAELIACINQARIGLPGNSVQHSWSLISCHFLPVALSHDHCPSFSAFPNTLYLCQSPFVLSIEDSTTAGFQNRPADNIFVLLLDVQSLGCSPFKSPLLISMAWSPDNRRTQQAEQPVAMALLPITSTLTHSSLYPHLFRNVTLEEIYKPFVKELTCVDSPS